MSKLLIALSIIFYRWKYRHGPIGVWGTSLGGGGFDMTHGGTYNFKTNGTLEDCWWSGGETFESTWSWKSKGNRTIEITHDSGNTIVNYDFLVRVFEGKKQVCLYELGKEIEDFATEPGFWTCPYPLILYRSPDSE